MRRKRVSMTSRADSKTPAAPGKRLAAFSPNSADRRHIEELEARVGQKEEEAAAQVEQAKKEAAAQIEQLKEEMGKLKEEMQKQKEEAEKKRKEQEEAATAKQRELEENIARFEGGGYTAISRGRRGGTSCMPSTKGEVEIMGVSEDDSSFAEDDEDLAEELEAANQRAAESKKKEKDATRKMTVLEEELASVKQQLTEEQQRAQCGNGDEIPPGNSDNVRGPIPTAKAPFSTANSKENPPSGDDSDGTTGNEGQDQDEAEIPLDESSIIQARPGMNTEEGKKLIKRVKDMDAYISSLGLSAENTRKLQKEWEETQAAIATGKQYKKASVPILTQFMEALIGSIDNLDKVGLAIKRFLCTFKGSELYFSLLDTIEIASAAKSKEVIPRKEIIGTEAPADSVYQSICGKTSSEEEEVDASAHLVVETIESVFCVGTEATTAAQKRKATKEMLQLKHPARNLIKMSIAIKIVIGVMNKATICVLSDELQDSISDIAGSMGIRYNNTWTLADLWEKILHRALYRSGRNEYIVEAQNVTASLILALGKFKRGSQLAGIFNTEAGRPLIGDAEPTTGQYYKDNDNKSMHQVRSTFLLLLGPRTKDLIYHHCALNIDFPRIILRNSYTNLSTKFGSLIWINIRRRSSGTIFDETLDGDISCSYRLKVYTCYYICIRGTEVISCTISCLFYRTKEGLYYIYIYSINDVHCQFQFPTLPEEARN